MCVFCCNKFFFFFFLNLLIYFMFSLEFEFSMYSGQCPSGFIVDIKSECADLFLW